VSTESPVEGVPPTEVLARGSAALAALAALRRCNGRRSGASVDGPWPTSTTSSGGVVVFDELL
jgi:hypothetical protein